ncbi:pentatricopeptide repeat-containing protein At1g10270-like [Capsella rubella]|uniref:pentatricopeptide repeat-containing protein At1g10270-like n=1 Tax=Capsella rubella TaxID=81985 RepID=UPI000CD4F364|nr:pentatricopeptide repeat-containing protein At1g10270-like [Capsella rubella]
MFLCRRLVLTGSAYHNSFRSLSSVVKKDPSLYNLDYRPKALQARVDFLIGLGDLDTAAKHARLAGKASAGYEDLICVKHTCQAIIGALCEAKRYKDALDLFHYLYRDSKVVRFDGYFNDIIRLHLDQGRLDDALNLYDPSRANVVTESLISKGLVDAGRLAEAMYLFKSSSSTSNMHMLLFERTLLQGDVEKANEELREAMDRLKPTKYTCMTSRVCMHLLEGVLRQGDVEKANEVLGYQLGRAHVSGVGYDDVAIFRYTYMKYWFEQGKEEKAMDCYSLLELGKLKEAPAVNAILLLFLKYGKKNEAWSLLDQVLHSQEMHNMNDYTLNIMVTECFKIGRFDRAIQIFHKVKALKLKNPDVTCYRNIITRLNRQGILFEAEHLFEEMCSDRLIRPDVSTYTAMISAYLKAGRTEDACDSLTRWLMHF